MVLLLLLKGIERGSGIFRITQFSEKHAEPGPGNVGIVSFLCCRGERFKETVMFGFLAVLFFFIAYFIGIPTVFALVPANRQLLFRPVKFAMSFTMGSFMTMLTIASIRGYSAYVSSMLQKERLPKTLLYLGSLSRKLSGLLVLVLTIFFSIVRKSYVMTIVCSLAQIAILAVYVVESLPSGGKLICLVCGCGVNGSAR